MSDADLDGQVEEWIQRKSRLVTAMVEKVDVQFIKLPSMAVALETPTSYPLPSLAVQDRVRHCVMSAPGWPW